MSKVLIIGGGLGGISAIVGLRKLNKSASITLVEPKEYTEVCWAAYRAPFEEWVSKGSINPLQPCCEKNNVKHIRTTVKSLSKNSAELENGETIEFDVCVVATGATTKWEGLGRGPHSYSVDDRLKLSKTEGEKLLNSGSVLVIGGGLIGTEVAGDIAGYAKQANKPMKVTLVHSQDHLCPEMSEKAAARVKQQLENTGVTVILNETATANEDGTFSVKGEKIEAKEVIMTVGNSACNDFFKAGGLETSLNDKGWVETDDWFRVKDTDGKIFSIGDCCTTLPNSGSQVLQNIKIIGFNINTTLKAIADGTTVDETKLKKFSLGPEVYLATTGPRSGVMYSKAMWTTWFFPRLKRQTMFFFRPKMELGLKPVT